MDFVDKYAKIQPEEREAIFQLLKQQETGIMIREAILQEGITQGIV